jgi:2-hydroxy-3-oxopropionate reductase
MKVGMIGIGRMGRPMVENLIRAGHNVVVQNRSQGKVQEMVAMGATAGASYAEMAASVESIHVCLADLPTVELVLTAPDGVIAGAGAGTIIVDHSTLHPHDSRRFAAMAAEKGATFLDAPVSGSGPVAERGDLTIMVGGDQPSFDKVKPALDSMGSTVRLMGPVGAGNLTKVINNLIMTATLAVSFEGAVLGTKAGLDPQSLFEVVSTASGNSRAWARNIPRALAGEFGNDGSIAQVLKDHDAARALGDELGVPLDVFASCRPLWQAAFDAMGDVDPSSGITIVEQRAGVNVRAI